MRGGIAARPDLDDPVFRRSAALSPKHRLDIRQVSQRDVGREGMRGAGEIQLPAVLVYLVVLQSAKRLVGGEYHFPTVFPIAVIVLLLVRVRAVVVAAALLEESVRDTLLRLVLLQVFPDLARIFQSGTAAVQAAVVMLSARVAGAVRRSRYQVSQFGGGELLRLLMLLLIEAAGTSAGRDRGGRSGEVHGEIARALEGVVQGIIRRGTPVFVRALAVQT